MKNVIIIHGCPDDEERAMNPETRTYDKHWMPWTKRELEKRGIKTETPHMPDPWVPRYENFKREFEKQEINEDSILIGTSCGCAFLVKWLGDSKQKIRKLILVAPWKLASEDKIEKSFYEYPIDAGIKDRVESITMFTADDEEEGGKESLKIFHNALGGKIINLQGHGHYIMSDMGTEEFPELIEEVLNA